MVPSEHWSRGEALLVVLILVALSGPLRCPGPSPEGIPLQASSDQPVAHSERWISSGEPGHEDVGLTRYWCIYISLLLCYF